MVTLEDAESASRLKPYIITINHEWWASDRFLLLGLWGSCEGETPAYPLPAGDDAAILEQHGSTGTGTGTPPLSFFNLVPFAWGAEGRVNAA